MGLIDRRAPTRWNDLDFIELTTPTNPFTAFAAWLTPLGLTADQALLYFSIDYEEALTEYPEDLIDNIIHMIATTNSKKYDKLLAAYQSQYDPLENIKTIENYTDKRSPQLTRTTNAGSKVDTTVENKQTRTETEDPGTYKSTQDTSRAPYDSTTAKLETKVESSATGKRSTDVSYTGDPDETHTNTTANTTVKDTGSETITHNAGKRGNTIAPQQLLDEEIALAEKMNIFKTIEKDIAAKVFIAVWPSY